MNEYCMDFLKYLCDRNIHFTVTSAYRTEEQNAKAGGVMNSQHKRGNALDLKPYGSTTYSALLTAFYDYLDYLDQAAVYFDELITYPTFIHVAFEREGTMGRAKKIDKR